MFEDPDQPPQERPQGPAEAAREKADEFRVHAQLAAVFEGSRKFDAQILPGLDAEIARDMQRTMARLEKAKSPDSPILPPPAAPDAARMLNVFKVHGLSTNDYHIRRRPGEVMITRWLEGDEVDSFYQRLQAHFDVALKAYREEEKADNAWRQDPKTLAYLAALDAIDIKMADRFLRDPIRQHNLFVLSTQVADEMDILHLCDYVMGVPAAEVVGVASAPPEEPTEPERAWFFKLFLLRGMSEGVERMCFFTYLQKTEDVFDIEE